MRVVVRQVGRIVLYHSVCFVGLVLELLPNVVWFPDGCVENPYAFVDFAFRVDVCAF